MEDGNTSITIGDGNLFVMSSSSSPSLSSASIDLARNIDYSIDQTMDGHKINNGAVMVENDIYFMNRSRPLQDQSESVIDPGLRSDGCDVIKQEVTKIMNFRMQKNLRKSVKCFMLTNYDGDDSNKSPEYYNKNQNKINNDMEDIDDQPIDYSIKSKRRRYSEDFNINDSPHEQDNYKSTNNFTDDQNVDPHLENNKDESNDYWSQMMKRHHRHQINTNNNFHAMKFQQWSRGMSGYSSQQLNADRGVERHFMGKVNFYNAYHTDLLQRIFYRDMWMAFQSKGFQSAAFNQNIPNIGGNFNHHPQNIFQHSSSDENHKSLKCLRKNSLVNRLLDNLQSIEDKSKQSKKHTLADETFTDIPGKSCNKNITEPSNTNPSSVKRQHKDKSITINTNQYGGCLGDFICQLCNERFDDAIGLAGHNCSKMAKVKYECPQCDKVFNCPANLASHRRWHKPKQ